jgi:hypothetical protein
MVTNGFVVTMMFTTPGLCECGAELAHNQLADAGIDPAHRADLISIDAPASNNVASL